MHSAITASNILNVSIVGIDNNSTLYIVNKYN